MPFLILLLSHYIGDYALQSEYLASNKGKSYYVCFAHVSIWTFVVSLTMLYIKLHLSAIGVLLILFIPHFIMDTIKARNLLWTKKVSASTSLVIDQAFHLGQLCLAFLIF